MNSLQELGSFLIGDEDTSSVTPDIDGNVSEQLKYIATLLNFTYGDDEPEYVLTTADGAGTYDASNLTNGTVADGVTFGMSGEGELLGDTDAEYVAGSAQYPGTLLKDMFNGTRSAGGVTQGEVKQAVASMIIIMARLLLRIDTLQAGLSATQAIVIATPVIIGQK